MINFNIERPNFIDKKYSILDFGAKSEVGFNNKQAIQTAIDTCSNNGGGSVIIPDGYYLTGPIELKSNVNLVVSENAYVEFSKSKEEYTLIWTEYEGIKRIRCVSPISAKNCTNIAITGKGIMDGNGFLWRGIKKWKLTEKEWDECLKISPYVLPNKEGGIWCPTKTYYDGVLKGEPNYNDSNALEIASENYDVYRPVLVSFVHCDKVLIEDVTLQNSPAWNVHPLYCTNFTIKNAQIKNKFSAQNGDGIEEVFRESVLAETVKFFNPSLPNQTKEEYVAPGPKENLDTTDYRPSINPDIVNLDKKNDTDEKKEGGCSC